MKDDLAQAWGQWTASDQALTCPNWRRSDTFRFYEPVSAVNLGGGIEQNRWELFLKAFPQ